MGRFSCDVNANIKLQAVNTVYKDNFE